MVGGGGLRPDFDHIVMLAKRHGLPISDIQEKKVLTIGEFRAALSEHFGLTEDTPLPSYLINAHWNSADTDKNGTLDFEEFLLWTINCGDIAALHSKNSKEHHVQEFAANMDLPLAEVERVMEVFTRYSGNGGIVEERGFRNIM